MHQEVVTRLRNAFAQASLEIVGAARSTTVPARVDLPFTSMTEENWRKAVLLWREHAPALLETVAVRPCPACGGHSSRWLFDSYDTHPFHECDQCGCWFTPNQVDGALFERLFERSPEARMLAETMMRDRDAADCRDADIARVGEYLDDLLPLLPHRVDRPIAYLDTGCGVGHSLRAALARGCQVQGVEIDRTAVALARASGLPVAGPGERFPEGPYDLLSFWETLEHIDDPLAALRQYLPHLVPDGLVAITVPNLNALTARTLREACAWIHGGYNTPGHVNLFHLPALERLLARAGLTVLDVDGQFSANPVELVAYLLGASRGAFDVLHQTASTSHLPEALTDVLTNIWPGMALLERLSLVSPILQVVACRKGQEARFETTLARRREARDEAMREQARIMMASEPDYKQISIDLQREVNRRDELLAPRRKGTKRHRR